MTSTEWAEVILRERRLKLSRFHEANDPFELNLIDSRDPLRRRIVRMIEQHHNERTGMICFGAIWDNPMMWAHYAEKHAGICLGFDVEDGLVSVVDYTDKKIDVEFGEHLPNHGLSVDLLNRVLLTKSKQWAAEQERRVLATLKDQDPKNGLYYSDFGSQLELREVIIGYRSSWTTSKAASLLSSPAASVRICKVRPAFGRFAMVRDHAVKAVTVRPKKARGR